MVFGMCHVKKLNANDPQTAGGKMRSDDVVKPAAALLDCDEEVATEIDEYVDQHFVDENRASLLKITEIMSALSERSTVEGVNVPSSTQLGGASSKVQQASCLAAERVLEIC